MRLRATPHNEKCDRLRLLRNAAISTKFVLDLSCTPEVTVRTTAKRRWTLNGNREIVCAETRKVNFKVTTEMERKKE